MKKLLASKDEINQMPSPQVLILSDQIIQSAQMPIVPPCITKKQYLDCLKLVVKYMINDHPFLTPKDTAVFKQNPYENFKSVWWNALSHLEGQEKYSEAIDQCHLLMELIKKRKYRKQGFVYLDRGFEALKKVSPETVFQGVEEVLNVQNPSEQKEVEEKRKEEEKRKTAERKRDAKAQQSREEAAQAEALINAEAEKKSMRDTKREEIEGIKNAFFSSGTGKHKKKHPNKKMYPNLSQFISNHIDQLKSKTPRYPPVTNEIAQEASALYYSLEKEGRALWHSFVSFRAINNAKMAPFKDRRIVHVIDFNPSIPQCDVSMVNTTLKNTTLYEFRMINVMDYYINQKGMTTLPKPFIEELSDLDSQNESDVFSLIGCKSPITYLASLYCFHHDIHEQLVAIGLASHPRIHGNEDKVLKFKLSFCLSNANDTPLPEEWIVSFKNKQKAFQDKRPCAFLPALGLCDKEILIQLYYKSPVILNQLVNAGLAVYPPNRSDLKSASSRLDSCIEQNIPLDPNLIQDLKDLHEKICNIAELLTSLGCSDPDTFIAILHTNHPEIYKQLVAAGLAPEFKILPPLPPLPEDLGAKTSTPPADE